MRKFLGIPEKRKSSNGGSRSSRRSSDSRSRTHTSRDDEVFRHAESYEPEDSFTIPSAPSTVYPEDSISQCGGRTKSREGGHSSRRKHHSSSHKSRSGSHSSKSKSEKSKSEKPKSHDSKSRKDGSSAHGSHSSRSRHGSRSSSHVPEARSEHRSRVSSYVPSVPEYGERVEPHPSQLPTIVEVYKPEDTSEHYNTAIQSDSEYDSSSEEEEDYDYTVINEDGEPYYGSYQDSAAVPDLGALTLQQNSYPGHNANYHGSNALYRTGPDVSSASYSDPYYNGASHGQYTRTTETGVYEQSGTGTTRGSFARNQERFEWQR